MRPSAPGPAPWTWVHPCSHTSREKKQRTIRRGALDDVDEAQVRIEHDGEVAVRSPAGEDGAIERVYTERIIACELDADDAHWAEVARALGRVRDLYLGALRFR